MKSPSPRLEYLNAFKTVLSFVGRIFRAKQGCKLGHMHKSRCFSQEIVGSAIRSNEAISGRPWAHAL